MEEEDYKGLNKIKKYNTIQYNKRCRNVFTLYGRGIKSMKEL